MLKKEKPTSIDEYSDALRKRLSGVLPEDKIEEVVAEAECHLEERAGELRHRADVFEKQAVAEFVQASAMARGVSRAWASTYLRHKGTKWLQAVSTVLCLLALAWFLGIAFNRVRMPDFLRDPKVVFWIPGAVFLLALLACRPQVRRFTLGGLAAIVLTAILGGWLCKSMNMGDPISRFDAPEFYKDTLAGYEFRNEEIRRLRTGINLFYGAPVLDSNAKEQMTQRMIAQKKQDQWLREFLRRPNAQEEKQLRTSLSRMTILDQEAKQYRFGKLSEVDRATVALREEILNQRSEVQERLKQLKNLSVVTEENRYQRQLSMIPSDLRVGNEGILVPRKDGWVGVFHQGPMPAPPSIRADRAERWRRTQIDAVRRLPLESVKSGDEALVRWSVHGRMALAFRENLQVDTKKKLNGYVGFIGGSKWRFDQEAARKMGTMMATACGTLVLADLCGGYLGMLLLRLGRKNRQQRRGQTTS